MVERRQMAWNPLCRDHLWGSTSMGVQEALPVLRRNKQPLMKLHCDIMGIIKAPSSCRVPGRSLLSTGPASALQSVGAAAARRMQKVSLNYLLEVTGGTFHRGHPTPTPHEPGGKLLPPPPSGRSVRAAQLQPNRCSPRSSIGCLMRNLLLSRWAGGPSRRPRL